ncbi:MAG: DAK2 domain-containing protein [Lachnospiraceae bacterium]|nr:DAK2 domain-containing protein [Lachnospiraceae bacterium]
MAVQTIDSQLLAKMFLAGANTLDKNKESINELNVFPVPDGDTGTNMTMTIMSAAKEVSALGDNPDMKTLCKAISGGSLRGARGNSGVILSQLLRGLTKRVRDEESINIEMLTEACAKATETAYKAVMKPTEGTILTVARGISDKAEELKENGCDDLETFLDELLAHGKVVLDGTPDLLPVLKQAGVVDSGGAGLICALEGAINLFKGKEVDITISNEPIAKVDDSRPVKAEEKTVNVYCVNFDTHLHRELNFKTEMDVKGYLQSVGDLVNYSVEGDLVKIHMHTDDPGLVIQKALKYGVLSNVKVSNRNLEKCNEGSEEGGASAFAEKHSAPAPKNNEPPKPYGFIAVSAGEGLSEIFKSLGVDVVIEGGQTMNPSTADVLDAVEKVNAETVFVLPNNKNIVMAAKQAADLASDKNVLVIPTKTIPQGITAIINFAENMTPDENEQMMMTEIQNVKTGEITYAVRDTTIDDKEIKKGDYMGIGDGKILSVGTDITQTLLEMTRSMVDDSSEIISIYYGSDVNEADAEVIREKITTTFGSCDVELQSGGQPIYYYIISVE